MASLARAPRLYSVRGGFQLGRCAPLAEPILETRATHHACSILLSLAFWLLVGLLGGAI